MPKRSVYLHDIPMDEAWAHFTTALEEAGLWHPLPGEQVALGEALGRVTAEPVWAKVSAPHYHASAMDGYAVRARDTRGASETSPEALQDGEGEPGVCQARVRLGSGERQHSLDLRGALEAQRARHAPDARVGAHGALEAGGSGVQAPAARRLRHHPLVEGGVPGEDAAALQVPLQLEHDVGPRGRAV